MKTLFSFFVYFTISGLLLIGCGGSQEEEPELQGRNGSSPGEDEAQGQAESLSSWKREGSGQGPQGAELG